jgi:hypothetical protein
MASLRGKALAIIGGLFGTVAMAGLFSGCGGDDTSGVLSDAALDGTGDVSQVPDTGGSKDAKEGGSDGTSTDAGREADVTVDVRADTSTDADATVGDSAPDNSAEGAVDAEGGTMDADSAADAPEEADADAAPEAGPNPIQQYAAQYAQAFCAGRGKCCPGYPGSFDQAGCVAGNGTIGWESTLPANASVYASGNLAFNADAGAGCIAALQNFACNPDGGPVTAAQYSAVTSACLRVLTGTIAPDSGGCVSSFECSNGYCNRSADGGNGTGVCTPLLANGATCSPGPDTPDEMCSQAGSYQPTRWCNRLDGSATGTCVAPLSNGATCYVPSVSVTYFDDYGCTTLLCGDDGLCGDPATYPAPGFCTSYIADAGGG